MIIAEIVDIIYLLSQQNLIFASFYVDSMEMFTLFALLLFMIHFAIGVSTHTLDTRSQWFPALLSWPCCVACCTGSSRAGETKWVNHKTPIKFA